MKKILLVLIFAVIANANGIFTASEAASLEKIDGNTAQIANSLNRIANALEKQNKLLEQLVPKTAEKSPLQKTIDYVDTLKQNTQYYVHKLVFPENAKTSDDVDDEQTNCIKECAEIYETTDKFELRECLQEMCGFSFDEIFK